MKIWATVWGEFWEGGFKQNLRIRKSEFRMGSFDGGRGGFSRLVALALLGLELVDHEGNFGVLSLARRGLGRNTLGKKLLSSSHVLSGSNTMNDNARGTEVNSNQITCVLFCSDLLRSARALLWLCSGSAPLCSAPF